MSKALCSPPQAILALVRIVAANWSLGTQSEVSEPDRPYTFFSAKTAVAFVQLSNDLRKWPASPQH